MDKIFTYDVCKICGEPEVLPSHFWKEHHIKECDYAWTYLPKRSKLTGNLIKFKNRDFYYNSDFNDKNELKKWIKENPAEALDYALSIIRKRYENGKLIYTPSQVELRSICAPNVIWYETVCDYNRECKDIGLRPRFRYKINLAHGRDPNFDYNGLHIDELNIRIDTREQKPLIFPTYIKTEISKLSYGDYWCSNSPWNHVYIERKGLSDFLGTLSAGYERFEKEIIRCQKDNNYLVVLVEECINNALAFNMLPHISKNIKASPEFIFKRVRDLIQKHPNVQFVFTEGREKAVQLLTNVYRMTIDPSIVDLQWLVDKKWI